MCSSVSLFEIKSCLKEDHITGETLSTCPAQEHISLLPFFHGNRRLLEQYRQSNVYRESCPKVMSSVTLLSDILEGKVESVGTQFEAPKGPPTGWNEDSWTKRLVCGIQDTLPESTATYTASMGNSWLQSYLPLLGLHSSVSRNYFLFTGAPDILIHHGASIIHVGQETEKHSSGDEIEISHQRPRLGGHGEVNLPEKTGELIAGLQMLLVCKMLRKQEKNQGLEKKYKVTGLLLDKVGGIVSSELHLDFHMGAPSPIQLVIKDLAFGQPDFLCMQLIALMPYSSQCA